MEKPYIKKWGEVSGITVWIVDGYYIRQNIDINFNNWGHHYRFNFIPVNEFWLDRQKNSGEEKYFIEYMLLEMKMVTEGRDYRDAISEGERIERETRDKDPKVKELKEKLHTDKEFVLNKIRGDHLKEYSNNVVKTYIVDSFLIRGLFYQDWVSGGHDKVYPAFIPPNEVWLDNDIVEEEMKYVLLHELHERYWMSQGWEYDQAHQSALEVEGYCHKYPKELEEKIKEELNRQM